MSEKSTHQQDPGVLVAEATPETKQPRMYRVLLMNDDYTPMDFVIQVLKLFFYKTTEQSTKIMLEVHYKGQGLAGVFTSEIAETKVAQVNAYAQANEHPLKCTMEPE